MGSVAASGLQTLLALVVVAAVLAMVARLVRGRGGGGRRPGRLMEVLERQHLAKGVFLAVVRVGGRHSLIAVTPSQVSELGEVEVADPVPAPASPVSVGPALRPARRVPAWTPWLEQLRELTVRRS